MSKYIFLFRGGMNMETAAPDKLQANMMKWKVWMDELAAQGRMLAGEPLERGGRTLAGRAKGITDGPFVESKELISGYLVIEAKSLDEATELGKGCPIFDHEGSVEVRPVMAMNR